MLEYIRNAGIKTYEDVLRDSLNVDTFFLDPLLEKRMVEMIFAYSDSWFILGTTSSVWTGKPRTMKGLRETMAPLCGTLLLTDDYPDMMSIGNFIPIYKYGFMNMAVDIIERYSRSKDLFLYSLSKQREWAKEVVMENQLSRILRLEGII